MICRNKLGLFYFTDPISPSQPLCILCFEKPPLIPTLVLSRQSMHLEKNKMNGPLHSFKLSIHPFSVTAYPALRVAGLLKSII